MRAAFALPLAALLLAGCVVGPRYAGPPAAAPRAAAGAGFARAGDLAGVADPPPSRWWQALGDPVLDALEARALAANPDVAVARARVTQARATLREQRANTLPKIDGSALYAHARIPGLAIGGQGGGSSDFDIYNLGFTASWEIDLFGGAKHTVAAARAQAQAADANLADAQVALAADVAQAYVGARDLQARIRLNRQAIAAQERMLALTRQRQAAGTAAIGDVENASGTLASARADAVPLDAQLTAYLDTLATLAGEEPGAIDAAMGETGPLPLPPARLAIGDPAALIRRRPDVRAAERTLAADTAKVGQATAARFPRLSFMGIVGIGGSRLSDLTHLDDFTLLAAPQLSWSFLDFGRTKAKVDEAKGVRDEAEAKYRGAVLAALKDAEGALARFRARRMAVASLARGAVSARDTAAATQLRYRSGTASLIDALEAERRRLVAEQQVIAAEAQLTVEFVAIQKALGLGWDAPDAAGTAISRG